MHPFASSDEVERVLAELAARSEPLAVRLERQPGRKEARWAQLLAAGGTGGTAAAAAVAPAPTADPPTAVVDGLLRSLVDALRARDVDAALELFAEDAVLLGSDSGERAEGHDELLALLGRFFEQPVTMGGEWERFAADRAGDVLWFLVEGDAVLQGEVEQRRPYRISGVVVPRDGRPVLVQFHGSEPAAT
jgi:uncharacterized protein (TIGR02246 family)